MVTDSCISPSTGNPAALDYFEELGVQVSEQVRLVVVTHWDDDHIRGMSRITEAATEAWVVCSAALRRQELVRFVFEQEGAGGVLGSGVDELRETLRVAFERERLKWAEALLQLYPVPPAGAGYQVMALSPSHEAVTRGIISLVEAAGGQPANLRRRFKAPERPNGTSVVTDVRVAGTSVLLGGDLERSNNPATGWDAVLEHAKPASTASAIKVPHHASDDAHHDGVWDEMLETGPLAVVTPWALGADTLPLERDLDRLEALTDELYLTAVPSLRRVRKDAAVEKLVRRLHGGELRALEGWGHVRARRNPNERTWRIELAGDATPCASGD